MGSEQRLVPSRDLLFISLGLSIPAWWWESSPCLHPCLHDPCDLSPGCHHCLRKLPWSPEAGLQPLWLFKSRSQEQLLLFSQERRELLFQTKRAEYCVCISILAFVLWLFSEEHLELTQTCWHWALWFLLRSFTVSNLPVFIKTWGVGWPYRIARWALEGDMEARHKCNLRPLEAESERLLSSKTAWVT